MSKRTKGLSGLESVIIEAIGVSGLNQVELAARSGISQGTLSRFLASDLDKRRTITLPVADRLCKALGLKLVKERKRKKGRKHA